MRPHGVVKAVEIGKATGEAKHGNNLDFMDIMRSFNLPKLETTPVNSKPIQSQQTTS